MIEVVGKATPGYEEDHIISKLYSFIEENVIFYTMLREILFIYGEVNLFEKEDFEAEIEILKINYPIIEEIEHTEAFFALLASIYTEYFSDDQDGYNKFRGDLTEYLVAHSGPFFFPFNEMAITSEAVILEEGRILQPIPQEEHNHNLDVCFHESSRFSTINDVVCEALECKTKIENFLREKLLNELPIKKKDRQDRDKVRYMEALGQYFSTNDMFKIAFATLTLNIEYSQRLLSRFPALNIEIISGKMLETALEKNN